MSDAKCRVLIMASGNGSNFQALVDGIAAGNITNATITKLIVNRSKAFATQRAKNAGIPWEYFNLVSHGFQTKGEKDASVLQASREAYDAALAKKILENDKPHLIVLAGWMHVFTKSFLDPLEAAGVKIINLHPALPGQYDGAHAIERAYDDFKAGTLPNNTTGIMVHFVIDVVDRGVPIQTREIVVQPGDSLDDLETKIHAQEHSLIVAATQQVVQEILAGGKPAL